MDRSSIDGRSMSKRSSWRSSTFSSVERNSQMVDMSTQTDFDAPPPILVPSKLPPRTAHNTSPKLSPKLSIKLAEIPESKSVDEAEPTEVAEITSKEDVEPTNTTELKTIEEIKPAGIERKSKDEVTPLPEIREDSAGDNARPNSSAQDSKGFYDVDFDDDSDDEVAVIQEIHQAAAPQVINRARMVTVAKPIAPKLPPRNPFRTRLSVNSDLANEGTTLDTGAGQSPMVSNRGQSPPPTPSLKNDMSSASSQHSISSDEGLERVGLTLQPKLESNEREKKSDEVISRPESPVKHVPGGFN